MRPLSSLYCRVTCSICFTSNVRDAAVTTACVHVRQTASSMISAYISLDGVQAPYEHLQPYTAGRASWATNPKHQTRIGN